MWLAGYGFKRRELKRTACLFNAVDFVRHTTRDKTCKDPLVLRLDILNSNISSLHFRPTYDAVDASECGFVLLVGIFRVVDEAYWAASALLKSLCHFRPEPGPAVRWNPAADDASAQ